MRTVSEIKGAGYLSSMFSVILLSIPALKSASEDQALLACLLGGVLLSIIGMGMRWRSHRMEQQERDEQQAPHHPRSSTAAIR